MKPLSSLTKKDIKDLKLVVFDVDGVTVKKGTQIEEIITKESSTLNVSTSNLTEEMKNKLLELKKKYYIAICSGRSSMYLTNVFNDLLWENCALISEIGIFTLKDGQLIQNKKFEPQTLEKMRNIKEDIAKLRDEIKDFRAFEPKQFLITLHAYSEIPQIYEIMKKNDPEEEFYCIWNGEAFDIAPKILDKGKSVEILSSQFGIGINQTMAIGNGPNDKSMTDAAGLGVTTEKNALQSDFYTEKDQDLGGFELIDKLLELSL